MKKLPLIPVILLALVGGVAIGGGVRMSKGAAGSKEHGAAGATKIHGGSKGHEDLSAKAAYMKFSRQFVAPVINNGAPIGMMILDVNIEIDPSIGQSAYAEEPRLRDAVMAVLLRQGAKGRLRDIFSDPAVLDETKAEILAASRPILGNGARSVLIMDIGYQRM